MLAIALGLIYLCCEPALAGQNPRGPPPPEGTSNHNPLMDTGVVGLFLIDSQWLARHFDFDSHMGKIESQTAMRTRINYALLN